VMNRVPALHPSTASKYSSSLPQSRPPSVSPNSLNQGLQVHLQTRSITASRCISSLAPLRSASSHGHGLQVHIFKLARLRPPSVSPNSLDHCLQVHLQTHSITASKCISNVARLRPRSLSLSALDGDFQAHLELLSSTACNQSRYSVCRWVAILIHRYIDENTH